MHPDPLQPKSYNTYTLKPGDTLESIATILGEDKIFIARFHNNYAGKNEIIGVELPIDLKQLHIKPQFSEKELANIPKISFLHNQQLELKPPKTPLQYQVAIQWNFGKQNLNITYQIQVQLIQKDKNYFVFQVNRFPLQEFENLDIYQTLDLRIMEAIYPLNVYIDLEGNYKGVQNFKAIKQQWEQKKQDILDEFEEKTIQESLQFYDTIFKEQTNFEEKLKKDIFWNVYFAGLHTQYNVNHYFVNINHNYNITRYLINHINFPAIVGTSNVAFKTNHYIDPFVNNDGLIEIQRTGVLDDQRAKQDFEEQNHQPYYAILNQDHEKAQGTYQAKYILDYNTHTIQSVYVTTNIILEEPQKIKCEITLIKNQT